jgi:hypothetical protein
MAEADSENRRTPGEALYDLDAAPCLGRGARPRRHHDPLRREPFDLIRVHFVVATDYGFGSQLAEELHEIPGEGIVIVDDQQHGRPS